MSWRWSCESEISASDLQDNTEDMFSIRLWILFMNYAWYIIDKMYTLI